MIEGLHVVIPARSGSKGVVDKNVRLLGSHPLIAWTITCAQAAQLEAPIVANSDDQKILDIAEGYGASSYRRAAHLANEHSTMLDVVRDYFRRRPEASIVMLLYPTCPFRKPESIAAALAVFAERGHSSLMSVHASRARPYGGVQLVDGKIHFGTEATAFYRRQDTPVLYHANGSIFIMRREAVEGLNNQLFDAATAGFVLDGLETLDIDSELDLSIAQALVQTNTVPSPFPAARGTTRAIAA